VIDAARVRRCSAPDCQRFTTHERCALHRVQAEAVPEHQPHTERASCAFLASPEPTTGGRAQEVKAEGLSLTGRQASYLI
jgi:ribosomal protein L44E